jgi:hypothetical protein
MTCEVSVQVPGFSGSFRVFLWSEDLEGFRAQLADMIAHHGRECQAELVGTEPGVVLRFAVDRRGHIYGRYELVNFDVSGSPALSGKFEMDRTYLAPLLARVDQVLRDNSF